MAEKISNMTTLVSQLAKGSDSASGTGIGLALVSNLCKLHRIDIKAESQPGEGSTFTLTLDALEQYPEAARRELEDTARTEEELSSIDNDFMKKFTELVEANMSNEDTGLPFLAQNLCMSQPTLYRKIKTITGLPPVENIRNIRLNKAAGMLVHTDLNISEICWKVGIGSPIYFRDCFKERYGKTPSAFREESRPAKQKSTK